MKHPSRARALLLALSLLAAVAAGEVAVRLAIRWTGRHPILTSDARLGWSLIPNLHDVLKVEDPGSYRISTDGEGHRLTRPRDHDLPPSTPTVVLVGDSFVQGQTVEDSGTFAWLLAASSGRRVVNLGVAGYGTDQELLALEQFLTAHPATPITDVVVVVFENDLQEVQEGYRSYFGMSKPRFELRGGRLERLPYRRPALDRLMNGSMLFWLVKSKIGENLRVREPEARDGIELVSACLREIGRLAVARGARCHLLAYHRFPVMRISRQDWQLVLERSGAEDITEAVRLPDSPPPIGYDGVHWSAEGHRRVAALLEPRLR